MKVLKHASKVYKVETWMAEDSNVGRIKSLGVSILCISDYLAEIKPDFPGNPEKYYQKYKERGR